MNLNLIAPINDLGYGCAGANLLRALSARHHVSLFPIGRPSGRHTPAVIEAVDAALANAKRYDPDAPSVRIWHQDDLAGHVGRGPRVGFPFFELDPLDDDEVHQVDSLDGLVVASGWARDVALRSGVRVPVFVVPLGVDPEVFHPKPTGLEGTAYDATTKFFNVGKWEVRKGHDVLVDAFNKAFGPDDDVMLSLCCHNPFLGEGNAWWERRCLDTKMGREGRIVVLPERLPDQHSVASFMNKHDVGVFPARAEGWNLDLLEAMACGKHVIATDYSGHTEFCGGSDAHLIGVDDLETADDGVWFHGRGSWARLGTDQIDQLVAHMRDLHRRKQTGSSMVNAGGLATARRFGWDHAADRLVKAFDLISTQLI